MLECLIDNTFYKDEKALHAHLKKLKIKQSDYYEKYHPKKDLYTGEPIEYKDRNQYFSARFLTKNNMKAWFKKFPDEAKKLSIDLLKERKETKNLRWALSETELRSIQIPSAHYYTKEFGSYNELCKNIGFQIKFPNESGTLIDKLLPSDLTVIIDTREQKPLNLKKINILRDKLDVGDYGFAAPYDDGVYIERKNISDFVGTIGTGYERFEKELIRCQESGSYLVMLVESDINTCLSFEYDIRLRYAKVSASHIFHNLRELLQKYDCWQCCFADGRVESARIALKILNHGKSVRDIDIQYQIEKKNF